MKKVLFTVSGLFFVTVIALSFIFIFKNDSNENDFLSEYININELSDEFMDKYYSDMTQLSKNDNLDNVLIVVSNNKPNDYGASMVVEAPNSTYILEYKDEYERDSAKEKLENDKDILSVTENRKYELTEVNTSNYNSWGIEKSGLNHAIEYINQNGGENVTVAIIDTGCDMNLFNESYNGKITEVYNFYSNETYSPDFMFDHVGHGTHIAGTIAEGTPSNVKILPVKVSDNDFLDTVFVIEAINYITRNHKADVINMSYSSIEASVPYNAEYMAIESAKKENIISVAAAGNSGKNDIEVPAAYDNTLSIGAIDSELNIAEFSTHNEYVSFTAPGVEINSINGVKSGTSMATPHAVCAVAFLKSIKKDLSFEETINALKQNVIDLGAEGRDDYFGYGFIDLSSFSICDDNNVTSCTSFDEKADFIPTSMEVQTVVYTPYNYGSLTNIMPTEIKLTDSNSEYKIVRLDKLDNIEITGYDPYATGEQTLTLKYLNLEKTFKVTNPENYELGWVYQIDMDDMGNLKDHYTISGYKDNNMELEKLYFPETIEGHTIYNTNYINTDYPAVFRNSNDAKFYKEVYLPSNIKEIGESTFSPFTNLYKVVSDADELHICTSAFTGLQYLKIIDANLLINDQSSHAFRNDYSLEEIRLSNNTTIIPSHLFYGCKNLETINLPEGITSIRTSAFHGTAIRNIVLPDSLQDIGDFAFHGTALEEITIPANVTNIGKSAFSGLFLDKIVVSNDNPLYDSRNNSNAIIRTADNALIVGSNKTSIPGTVKTIEPYAFFDSYVVDIELPEGLETIGGSAFKECSFLKTVKLPRSIKSISNNSFITNKYLYKGTTCFYVYNLTYSHNFVESNGNCYIIRDLTPNPPIITEQKYSGKIGYLPFETLDISSYTAKITYAGVDDIEIVNSFRNPEYEDGRDYLMHGDWSAWLYYDTAQGYHNLKMEIPVNVGKLTPEYEIPTDVYANVNSTLADVDLPKGFEWEDNSILLSTVGNVVYDARYVPEDSKNYEIVEHIAIPIRVINKTLVKPTITIENKLYDGTATIPLDSITITGLNSNEYSISNIEVTNISENMDISDAGSKKVFITLKLSNNKFSTHAFSNGKQERVFECTMDFLPEPLDKPTMVDKTYVYNGENQTVLINGFDSNKMTIAYNVQKNAGKYSVGIGLKNQNYIWSDGSKYSVWLTFKIEKADIDYTASDEEVIYDGQAHGIEIETNTENATILYMDSNGEYTLTEMPKYTEIGEYTIKYKISVDDNYNEVVGENALTIKEQGIINNTEDYETIYDGNNHTITLDLNVEDYTAHYSINNTNYDLDTLPEFKDVGEYTIYYKIDKENYNSVTGSNKVRIYGIQELDPSISIKDSNLIVNNETFESITNKITIYSKSTDISHIDVENNVISRNELKTGDIINIRINNSETFSYNISLLGDIDKDGVTSIRDMYQVYLLYKNKYTGLTPVQIAAADFNNDGRITIMDLYHVYLKMKGKE